MSKAELDILVRKEFKGISVTLDAPVNKETEERKALLDREGSQDQVDGKVECVSSAFSFF